MCDNHEEIVDTTKNHEPLLKGIKVKWYACEFNNNTWNLQWVYIFRDRRCPNFYNFEFDWHFFTFS